MKSSRPPTTTRDGQQRTGFTTSLEALMEASAGCIAAVLVDGEGETVDYAGRLRPYDIKLAAAHLQIVLRELCNVAQAGAVRAVLVRAQHHGYLARRLFGDYVLVLVCTPDGPFEISERALRQVEVELSREAEWPLDDRAESAWTRVYVCLGSSGAPSELWLRGGARAGVTVLAPAEGLVEFERGYRVRTAAGRELTLVREPNGTWYVDGPID